MATATIGADVVTYSYDHDWRRVAEDVNGTVTNYLWDEYSSYGDILLEYNSAAVLNRYVYGADSLIAQTSPAVSYYLSDALGSTRLLTDATGTVTDTYTYDAFGEIDTQSGTSDNAYLYTGQRYDSLTDQYYLRARQYDPGLGRFLSRDPWPLDYQNPVELNRYVYAAANPVMWSDPSGYTITGVAGTYGEISGRNIPILSGLGTVTATYYAKLTFSVLRKWAITAAIDWLLDQLDILDPGNLPQDLLDITINQVGGNTQALTQAEAQAIGQEKERVLERLSDRDWDFVGYHGTATRNVPHIVAKIDPPRNPNSGANQL